MPIALAFFIAIVAETNRPPFDLSEAESELVAGFMTEHGASIFVFFFLGEYSSLILMSSFMAIFFLGGYHCPDLHNIVIDPLFTFYYYLLENNFIFLGNIINDDIQNMIKRTDKDTIYSFTNILFDKIHGSYILGIKIILVVFFYR